ncbi:hypothetical protein [Neobacillus sp.]|uniref:hypothetical protein n=1 Tax=Neobacillus sp. TaxID=2675273 RepID=UPI0035B56515
MYFDTKKGPVYEPENQLLSNLYKVLEKHAPILEGSRLFEDLVEVYEDLEMNLKEDSEDGKTIEINKPIATELQRRERIHA